MYFALSICEERKEEKEKNWYGITIIGQHTERVKAILKKKDLLFIGKEEKNKSGK